MVEKGRQKARMAVAQWGCGLPVVFALVVLCPAGSEHNVPHALALRSLWQTQTACNLSQRGLAREEEGSSSEIVRLVLCGLILWAYVLCVIHLAVPETCQQSRTYVPETALRPLSSSCDPSSGVTADKPQPTEVVWAKTWEWFYLARLGYVFKSTWYLWEVCILLIFLPVAEVRC